MSYYVFRPLVTLADGSSDIAGHIPKGTEFTGENVVLVVQSNSGELRVAKVFTNSNNKSCYTTASDKSSRFSDVISWYAIRDDHQNFRNIGSHYAVIEQSGDWLIILT